MTTRKADLRISKTKGKILIFIAIIFDLLPLITLGIMFYIFFQTMVSDSAKSTVQHYVAAQKAREQAFENDDSTFGGALKEILIYDNIYALQKLATGYYATKTFFGGAVAITATTFIGPIIYSMVSLFSTIFAYILFTLLFFFNRVNIWSFSKPKKIFLNLITFIAEEIPLVDLLPGTTIMVWRHVKMSQIEDKMRHKENFEKTLNSKHLAYA